MARTPNPKEVMARVWASEQGLKIPTAELEDDWNEDNRQDVILPGHVQTSSTKDDTQLTKVSLDKNTDTDTNNPVTSYINELIIDLVSKNHTRIMNMQVIRNVFRSVLLKLCDAEPHTFSEIRSSVTRTRRDYVKQVLTRLQSHNIVVEIELNNRLFYRIHLDEVAKVRAYIVATESIR